MLYVLSMCGETFCNVQSIGLDIIIIIDFIRLISRVKRTYGMLKFYLIALAF